MRVSSKREKITMAIVLALSVIISLTFLVYAFIQTGKLKKAHTELGQARLEIIQLRSESEELQKRAMDAAAEALKQRRLVEKALRDCQSE